MRKAITSVLATSVIGAGVLVSGCGANTGGAGGGGGNNNVITIGTLYAQSGQFATSSMPEYKGLEFWANQVNANGGVMVKATGKKEKVKIVAYNDESSTETATNLYSQLITKDHVDMLVSDFGSVLTSAGIPIAKEHKMLFFDQSGSGATFFPANNPNPYIVLTSIMTSALWPDSLANYITTNNIKKVAVVYDSNDFTGSQNTTLLNKLKAAGITPVYDHAVPTDTSDYSVLLHDMAATNPDMVIEFGYSNNDIAFLQALNAGSYNFKKVFTIFPGQLPALFQKDIGTNGIANTYTYPAPPLTQVSGVNYGLSLPQFTSAFEKYSGDTSINFLDIAGYNTGLVLQKTLETATSLKQEDLRKAVNQFSGQITTIEGTFKINTTTGAQEGLAFPVGQWQLQNGKLTMKVFNNTIQ